MQTTNRQTIISGNETVAQAVRDALRAEAEAGPDYLTTLHDRVMARVQTAASDGDVRTPAAQLTTLLGIVGVLLIVIALLALTHLR